ncbi:MAG: glycosyltransferase [Bacillota bacterium]
MSEVFLSAVIPTKNEARRLPETLAAAVRFFSGTGWKWELVVADASSPDGTAEVAREYGARVVSVPHSACKGENVRAGMLVAAGRWRLMADADGATPWEETGRLLEAGADVVVGRRPFSRPGQPLLRKVAGWAFAAAQYPLTGVPDSQCGFKLFSAQAAEGVFRRLAETGFAFDVEAIVLAKKLGFRVVSVPVKWADRDGSTVTLARGMKAFGALAKMYLRLAAGELEVRGCPGGSSGWQWSRQRLGRSC